MKTLYLLRHAKSSWDNPDLDDHHRPLNHRGEKDAPKMGKRLRRAGVKPNLICSSSATRAITTARLAAEEMDYPAKSIREEKRLYHAGPDELLDFLHSLNDGVDTVMLVGHNPGLTEFANSLLDEEIDNIPTAGLVGAQLGVNSWKDVKWGCGKLTMNDYPKKDK